MFVPSLALAADVVVDATSLTKKLVDIGNVVIYLLVALAVVFIIWNVVMSLIKSGEPAEKTKALGNIGYGILGLAIIVSIWGIVNVIVGTFRTTPTNQPVPNIGNNTVTGGVPLNQIPEVR